MVCHGGSLGLFFRRSRINIYNLPKIELVGLSRCVSDRAKVNQKVDYNSNLKILKRNDMLLIEYINQDLKSIVSQ